MIALTHLSGLDWVIPQVKPVRLVSLLEPEAMIATPGGVYPAMHLKIEVDDIVAPQPGTIHPREDHIRRLLEFGARWDGETVLLVHCAGGRSRSPAALMILLVQKNPGREVEVARMLYERAPHICPNRLMVELGDRVLGLDGRLVAALDGMPPPDGTLLEGFRSFPVRVGGGGT